MKNTWGSDITTQRANKAPGVVVSQFIKCTALVLLDKVTLTAI